MMSCRTATQLLSEAQDRALPLGERTPLRMHLWMCSGCRQFGQQVEQMRVLAQAFAQRSDLAASPDPEKPDAGA